MPVKAPWACKCGKRIAAGQSCPCCTAPRKRAHDANRPNARQRGYDTKWEKERKAYLAANPWCCKCAAHGIRTKATVVNHIIPHRMDLRLFWNRRNWEPVCAPCHNGATQSEEKRQGGGRWGYSIPHGVKPSGIPVTIVCGPPAAGKSTYVRTHAAPDDTVIDFDLIRKQVGGEKWDLRQEINDRAFAIRDQLIRSLHDKTAGRAWLIVMAPTKAERAAWRSALGNVTEVMIAPPKETCFAQMRKEPDRRASANRQRIAIDRWFNAFDGASANA